MQSVLIQLDGQDVATLIREAVQDSLANSNPLQATPTAKDVDQFLTQEEVAKFLRCTKQTVINWVRKGLLPETRIGRRVMYSKSDVLRQIAGRK